MSLQIEGLVAKPRSFSGADLASLGAQVADISAHIPGRSGVGVRLAALLEAAGSRDDARWLSLTSADGFRIAVPLAALRERGIVAYGLAAAAGGPVRLYVTDTPECHGGDDIDKCANVKQLVSIRVTAEREPDIDHEH